WSVTGVQTCALPIYLGGVYAALHQYDQALPIYEQALARRREVGYREGEGETFGHLMALWKAQHQPRLAIFYGKQAINAFQEIRRSEERRVGKEGRRR